MNSFLYTSAKFIYHLYWDLITLIWRVVPTKHSINLQHEYSIGIVTYIDRFERYFKPLIKSLNRLFPDTEIVVVINGYYDLEKQRVYLNEIKLFLTEFPQVKIVSFEEGQSLSKLWNLVTLNAHNDKVLILNDDLRIAPWFRKKLEKSNFFKEDIALINRSWSHFLISKDIIRKVGWFDERFPAIGNEDEDYEARLIFKDIPLLNFKNRHILNVIAIPQNYSYGQNIPLVHVKYAQSNHDFFQEKWEKSTEARPGFKYVPILSAFVKPKEKMETPDFYTDYIWQ